MSWASAYVAKLQAGETVKFRPRGNSMSPKIESGQLCTVEPIRPEEIRVGDVVLCSVNGSQYLHIVKAQRAGQFQIGNNKGRINGWTSSSRIYGVLTKVEP